MCRPGPGGCEGPARGRGRGGKPEGSRREAGSTPALAALRDPPTVTASRRAAEPPPLSPIPGPGSKPPSALLTQQSWGKPGWPPEPGGGPGGGAAGTKRNRPGRGPDPAPPPRHPPMPPAFHLLPRTPTAATPPRRPGRAPRPNPRTNCNPIKADIILLVFTAHQGGDNNRRCRRAAARQPPAPAGSVGPGAASQRAGTRLPPRPRSRSGSIPELGSAGGSPPAAPSKPPPVQRTLVPEPRSPVEPCRAAGEHMPQTKPRGQLAADAGSGDPAPGLLGHAELGRVPRFVQLRQLPRRTRAANPFAP